MSVACGIVGLPNVGKSTLFNALTAAGAEAANYPFCTIEPNIAIVEVPDANLQTIAGFIKTQKIIPAAVRVVDIAGLIAGASKGEGMGNQFLANIRETDAIMQVVRCFETASIVREAPIDPVGDIEIVEAELCLADLSTAENAVTRAGKKARTGDKDAKFELAVCERAVALLSQGKLIRSVDWKPEELAVLRPLCLMTQKRMLYVANVSDEDLTGESELAQRVAAHAEASGAEWLPICADLECELRSMDREDRAMFMEELGVERLGLERLITKIYDLLGLQTFYTAGPKEIRAWTCKAGVPAPVAAGVIHTDFERLFIRAEVYSIADLAAHGTESAIKAAGKMRTEGREYALRADDVCHFLIGK
ncbi:MAG: redox-regulated ATPase YchF [Planctomycetota bacterium]|nr:redox-regulated ATPase YchF [Planctomycetota bacterium]